MNSVNECAIVVSGWVDCRKVSDDISRHWSSWKDRVCEIHDDLRMSLKTSGRNGLTTLHLLLRSCSQHYYAEYPHVLSLKCVYSRPKRRNHLDYLGKINSTDNSSLQSTELFFKFKTDVELQEFQKKVDAALKHHSMQIESLAIYALSMLREHLFSSSSNLLHSSIWNAVMRPHTTTGSGGTSNARSGHDRPPLPLHPSDLQQVHGNDSPFESAGQRSESTIFHDINLDDGGLSRISSPDVSSSHQQQEGIECHVDVKSNSKSKSTSIDITHTTPGHVQRPSISKNLHRRNGSGSSNKSDGSVTHKSLLKLKHLTVPLLNIVLIAVGTRGDVAPFAQLGQQLKQQYGHRIRIATHECFRDYVLSCGLEFYPLAGDPLKLSEFMVRSQGFLIPTTREMMNEIPKNYQMTVDIMRSCWAACTQPGSNGIPFTAQAIISNPVSYGHIHCAEALGVPLHIMFPQPWVPTKAFPHPLACFSYFNGWCTDNFMSYQMVEQVMWLSLEKELNDFRMNTLNLPPIRMGEQGWDRLNYNRVPFVEMWSDCLAPRPKDWGNHVDISGFFFDALPVKVATIIHPPPPSIFKGGAVVSSAQASVPTPVAPAPSYKPAPELAQFLFGQMDDVDLNEVDPVNRPAKPIFIGFGSMVMDSDTEQMLAVILEAAAIANVRILYQTGWSGTTAETFKKLARAAELGAQNIREVDDLEIGGLNVDVYRTPAANIAASASARSSGQYSILESYGNDLYKQLSYAGNMTNSMTSQLTTQASKYIPPSTITGINQASLTISTNVSNSLNYVMEQLPGSINSSYLGLTSSTTSSHTSYRGNSGGAADRNSVDIRSPSTPTVSAIAVELSSLPSNASGKVIPTPNVQQDNDISNSTHQRLAMEPDSPDDLVYSNRVKLELESNRNYHYHRGDREAIVNHWSAERDALMIGPAPHSWLFEQVAAVVHHGGAGTSAAGLRAGKPTMVCPFFGDQNFWGERIYSQGCGPKPCSVGKFTVAGLVEAFQVLLDPETQTAVNEKAVVLRQEDGVTVGCRLFHQHLPVPSMICDVSLFLSPQDLTAFHDPSSCKSGGDCSITATDEAASSCVAEVYCVDCGLKMSLQISNIVHGADNWQHHQLTPVQMVDWDTLHAVSAVDGVYQGLAGGLQELVGGLRDVVAQPLSTIYNDGLSAQSVTTGVSRGVASLMSKPAIASRVFMSKLQEGALKSFGNDGVALLIPPSTMNTITSGNQLVTSVPSSVKQSSTNLLENQYDQALQLLPNEQSTPSRSSSFDGVQYLKPSGVNSVELSPDYCMTDTPDRDITTDELLCPVSISKPNAPPPTPLVLSMFRTDKLISMVESLDHFRPSSRNKVDHSGNSPHLSDIDDELGDIPDEPNSDYDGDGPPGHGLMNQSLFNSMYISHPLNKRYLEEEIPHQTIRPNDVSVNDVQQDGGNETLPDIIHGHTGTHSGHSRAVSSIPRPLGPNDDYTMEGTDDKLSGAVHPMIDKHVEHKVFKGLACALEAITALKYIKYGSTTAIDKLSQDNQHNQRLLVLPLELSAMMKRIVASIGCNETSDNIGCDDIMLRRRTCELLLCCSLAETDQINNCVPSELPVNQPSRASDGGYEQSADKSHIKPSRSVLHDTHSLHHTSSSSATTGSVGAAAIDIVHEDLANESNDENEPVEEDEWDVVHEHEVPSTNELSSPSAPAAFQLILETQKKMLSSDVITRMILIMTHRADQYSSESSTSVTNELQHWQAHPSFSNNQQLGIDVTSMILFLMSHA